MNLKSNMKNAISTVLFEQTQKQYSPYSPETVTKVANAVLEVLKYRTLSVLSFKVIADAGDFCQERYGLGWLVWIPDEEHDAKN